jgi:AcrR family transcriptional regulator
VAVNRTLRQQRADDTKRRLVQAAAQLFAQKGYHDTTVDEIARLAGVAKGTFFVHFPTKDAVITVLMRRQIRSARRARAEAKSPIDALVAAVMTLGVEAGASRALLRACLAASLDSAAIGGFADAIFGELMEDMMEDVRLAQEGGILRPDADPQTVVEALIASYLGASVHFVTSPRMRPLPDVLRQLVEANLEGFRVSHSRRR